jgi:ABC-2 type transport system permease protein
MKQTFAIVRKELDAYFGSPMALIFLGAFLAVTLFTFFWVDTFFARGIADVRPLFRWMPLLTIFLVAALTMRQWSEEQHSGTLEMLLTLPVQTWQLALGKFLAVIALVGMALVLTLPLPITVSILGNLDWGPVVGGYLAALLLAAAYAAIGLFVSSRTDNQIVALIATVLLGGLLYMVGTPGITDFVGGSIANILRSIGTGSRFESIERGVIDLRDLVYYLSLTALFMALNIVSLDSKRWSRGMRTLQYRRNVTYTVILIGLNLALLNTWLYPLYGLRVDLTQQKEYSLSPVTKQLISNLQEPLLIRAYISEKTHPLLMPLVPQISDTLREYEIASRGKITTEVVDPIKHPDLEAEAAQTYGIRPTPFQVAGRYESSVINSYFDILVRYGDQNVVLNFRDLIEVEPRRDGTVDVHLRNLEYDLTRAIKKVVYGFQSVDAVLEALDQPAKLTLFVTPDTLPEALADAPNVIAKVAQEYADKSGGKFSFASVNPDAPDSTVTRQQLYDSYGLQPIAATLFSNESYYLYMLLEVGDQSQIIYPGGDLTEADVRTAIESALKRMSTGFLKVVGLWTPPATPTQNAFGQMQQPFSSWNMLFQQLRNEYQVRFLDLENGQVPNDIDVLVVVAPQNLTDKQRFAIDQYLMRGGSVVAAAGNYTVIPDQFSGALSLQPVENGLRDMLAHYGVDVQNSLVMDPQNEPFPLPVVRQVGGFQVQEIQAVNYPFFVDVRPDAMDSDSPITGNLAQVTMNWASPITLDPDKNADRETHILLQSSAQSWLRSDTDIQPNFDAYPDQGFPVEGEPQAYPLAVSVQGVFESYFKDKPSPFQPGEDSTDNSSGVNSSPGNADNSPPGTIETSSPAARLVVIGSAEFLDDVILQLSTTLTQDRYRNNLLFVQNAVDWSVEDLDLLTIRARGANSRVLKPLTEQEQSLWEMLNYAIALLALAGIALVWRLRRRSEKPMALAPVPVEATGD